MRERGSSFSDVCAVVLGGVGLTALVLGRRWPSGGVTALVLCVAVVTVPLVLADVRERRLPNLLTGPLLLGVPAKAAADFLGGRAPDAAVASLSTALLLGVLHAAGGLGLGDVKLGAALASPLSAVHPAAVVAVPALAFLLAGAWALPLLLRGDCGRIPFGPFFLSAFWLVLLLQ
ncbi:prepilin peptidase [Rathayibacter toxicus]|uniref:Prepilin type IV endopeptidase peptidase domain-containing protein n=1 Tax=Rathayibacter toxicus TaxID=145458 RepID=A0A2S5Y685_9MICO|nr:prepilin peptidase [Rathayibacter toxicus]ALS57853.1 hypothetical protein APU90_08785 [Rathayibacter toxicus]PPG20475.1 hypothetical protein C5D15_08140 [Rathayibacter toxicus]PPG45577.1 hypothetical protein C5D16_08110 [Rathayibacter toxicus]PPH22677.1 hypothetical protein C5D17_08150 [Rathayibacter toxicus]PPH56880.1 hypothetical protein C5D30_08140 [Rathayibacter toxicus]